MKINIVFASISVILVLPGCTKKTNLIFKDELSLSSQCTTTSSEPTAFRRLTKRELVATLTDIFGQSAMTAVSGQLDFIPPETSEFKFDRLESTVEQMHVEGLFSVSEALSYYIIENQPTFFGIGACVTSTNDQACISKFISEFGFVLFRKPVTADVLTRFLALYSSIAPDSKSEAAKVLMMSMLQSPDFYYLPEFDGVPASGDDVLRLTPYELATRLAYTFSGTAPSLELLTLAKNGGLQTEDQIFSEAEKLMTSIQGRNHFNTYFAQYLHLENSPNFANYSLNFLNGQSTQELGQQMVDEVIGLMGHYTFDSKGTFQDLMSSPVSVLKKRELASLYETVPSTRADGLVTLSDPKRRGILTRAALLTSGKDTANPFHRGKTVLTEFLCQDIDRPDPTQVAEAFANVPNLGTVSTRTFFEGLTSRTACLNCHASINSFGFAFEEFDALGRFRKNETFHNPDGTPGQTFSIDSVTHPVIGSSAITVTGAADLSVALGQSSKASSCFARKWYRFAMGRRENPVTEGCTFQSLAAKATNIDKGLKSMFLGISNLPQFNYRIRPRQ
jgi:hypothetical protein